MGQVKDAKESLPFGNRETAHAVVFEPFVVGHSVYKLKFMVEQLRSLPGHTEIIPLGNRLATPEYLGLAWQHTSERQRMPTRVFIGYICLALKILARKPGRRFFFNLAYDSTWYHFGVFVLFLAPLFRMFGIRLICLQFRSRYLKGLSGLTDLAKYCVFLMLRAFLGRNFVLLTTHMDIPPRRNVRYLPDLMDIPGRLPTKEEARDLLKLPREEKLLLFFGNIHDPRKGFDRVVRLLDKLPFHYKILLQEQREGQYKSFIEDNDERFRVIEGIVDNRTKSLMFRAADGVLILYGESFGGSSGVMTDAILHKTPVVTTRFPFGNAIMEKHKIGYFVNPESVETWRSALAHIEAGDPTLELHRCREKLVKGFENGMRSLFVL